MHTPQIIAVARPNGTRTIYRVREYSPSVVEMMKVRWANAEPNFTLADIAEWKKRADYTPASLEGKSFEELLGVMLKNDRPASSEKKYAPSSSAIYA